MRSFVTVSTNSNGPATTATDPTEYCLGKTSSSAWLRWKEETKVCVCGSKPNKQTYVWVCERVVRFKCGKRRRKQYISNTTRTTKVKKTRTHRLKIDSQYQSWTCPQSSWLLTLHYAFPTMLPPDWLTGNPPPSIYIHTRNGYYVYVGVYMLVYIIVCVREREREKVKKNI
jgi:hypothetical protein